MANSHLLCLLMLWLHVRICYLSTKHPPQLLKQIPSASALQGKLLTQM